MKIYVTGPVGTGGALKLYKEHQAEMDRRFPRFFRRQIEQMADEMTAVSAASGAEDIPADLEIMLAKYADCIYICTMGEGGLFQALWNGCEKLKCGCEVFLETIPIRQETVEITELTGDNPYEIESSESLLLFSEQDSFDAKQEGLHLIGRTTAGKDRVVICGENRRFLTPPGRQKKDTENRRKPG